MPINIPVLSTLAALAAGNQNLSVIDAIFTVIRSALTGIAISATDVLAGSGISVTVAGGQVTVSAAAGGLFRQVAAATISNNATEQTLFTVSVAGGTLSTNKMIRATAWGQLLNNTGGNVNFRLRVYYGATVCFDSGNQIMAASANTGRWDLAVLLAAENLTNAQSANSKYTMTQGGAGADIVTGVGHTPTVNFTASHDTLAIDSTAAQTFKITIIMDVAAATATTTIEQVQGELV